MSSVEDVEIEKVSAEENSSLGKIISGLKETLSGKEMENVVIKRELERVTDFNNLVIRQLSVFKAKKKLSCKNTSPVEKAYLHLLHSYKVEYNILLTTAHVYIIMYLSICFMMSPRQC